MKLVTVKVQDEELIGVLLEGRGIVPIEGCCLPYHTMNDLIAGLTSYEADYLERAAAEYKDLIPLEEAELCAPIPDPKQDIICVGLNYRAHCREAASFDPASFTSKDTDSAVYFSKRVSKSVGDQGTVIIPHDFSNEIDYEAELAVILNQDAYRIAEKDVKDYIFGYTVINDMTARDQQKEHRQWYLGKSFDGSTPMGPCIVTADAVPYPPVLSVSSFVNGKKRQLGSTKEMIHSIDEMIAELSQGMTLKAGTILSTGTPQGVGMGMKEPKFLKDGDTVECRIDEIGPLTVHIKVSE